MVSHKFIRRNGVVGGSRRTRCAPSVPAAGRGGKLRRGTRGCRRAIDGTTSHWETLSGGQRRGREDTTGEIRRGDEKTRAMGRRWWAASTSRPIRPCPRGPCAQLFWFPPPWAIGITNSHTTRAALSPLCVAYQPHAAMHAHLRQQRMSSTRAAPTIVSLACSRDSCEAWWPTRIIAKGKKL